ncbi:hypothetical protein VTN96DRAFT_963 [Rasamsonia emersonii]
MQEVKDDIESQFEIGPIVQREFWKGERSKMHCYHGPWRTAKDYLESLARREMKWINDHADPTKDMGNPWLNTSKAQRSPNAHIDLLQRFLSAIPYIIPKDTELTSPRLWHPDFHAGNIFVDNEGKITSLIDWQGAWAEPMFLGSNPPKLLDYGVDILMNLPENFSQLDEDTKDQLRYRFSQSVLIHAYETRTAVENPLMHRMMHNYQGKTLKEIVAFASDTWDSGLFPLRECLIRIEREWDDFDADEPCPYHFTEEEIQEHQEESKSFNDNAYFWDSIREIVTNEGYTSNEDFPRAVEIFQRLRESGLKNLEGDDREEFDKQTRWIRDIRM